MRTIKNIGIAVSVIGGLATVINFMRLYGLAGLCTSANLVCGDVELRRWRLHQAVAIGVLVFGLVLLAYAWYVDDKRKHGSSTP